MKNTIATLMIFALLISVPFAHATSSKKSVLIKTSDTPMVIYLEMTPAIQEPVKRIRIIRVQAEDAYEADIKLARGQTAVYYKRRAKRIRMGGLRPSRNYCFKGNYISAYKHRGGNYATNADQEWNPALETDWLCTSSGEDPTDTIEGTEDGLVRYAHDLLVQSAGAHPKMERKTVNGKKTSGHWVNIVVHNAGTERIDSADVKLACVEKSPSSQANQLVGNLSQGLNPGESYKINLFVTRKVTQLCQGNFEITLPEDEVKFNNKVKIRLGRDSGGRYNINHY